MTDVNPEAPLPEAAAADRGSFSPASTPFLWLFVSLILLYVIGVNGFWRFQRDSALYIGLARNLAETGRLVFNGRAQPEALPGLPVLLSGVYIAFGESFLLMNLLVSATGVGTVVLAWLLYRELPLTGRQAFACTLLLGLSRTLYYYSTHLMTEVPFLFWGMLALWSGARMLRARGASSWLWCTGSAFAAAVSCTIRPVGPTVIAGLLAAVWWRSDLREQWKHRTARSAVLILPTALFLGWLAWWVASSESGPGESAYYTFVAKRGILGMVWHLLIKVPRLIEALPETMLGVDLNLPGGILLLALIVPGIVVSLRRGERILTVYAVACIAAAMLGAAGDRYLLPALPGIVYWAVLGFEPAWAWLGRRASRVGSMSAERAAKFLLAFAAASNVVRVADVIYEARQPTARDFYRVSEGEELLDYWNMVDVLNDPQDRLRESVVRHGRVLAHEGRMIHYFTGGLPTRPLHGKRARRLRTPGLVKLILAENVGYVVRDPDDDYMTAMIDEIRDGHPGALTEVRTFGALELLRVDTKKLGDPGR